MITLRERRNTQMLSYSPLKMRGRLLFSAVLPGNSKYCRVCLEKLYKHLAFFLHSNWMVREKWVMGSSKQDL